MTCSNTRDPTSSIVSVPSMMPPAERSRSRDMRSKHGGVRRELHHRCDRIADRRAATGREDHQLCAGRDETRRRLLVVPGPCISHSPLPARQLGVAAAALDARGAGLGDRAERLDGDVEQAARDVARARILAEHGAELGRVLLVPVDHLVHGLAGRRRSLARVREDVLGAAELGHFGDEHGAALLDEQIRRVTERRVRREAGKAVGSAALHAERRAR